MWSDELISDSLTASVRTLPGVQPVSGDGEYEALLFTSFLEPTVTLDPVGAGDANVTVRMHLEDNAEVPRVIPPPFSAKGFTVTCSVDATAYAPCLDSGVATFAKTPLAHTLDVKTVASDGATVVKRVTWNGGPEPLPPAPPPGAKPLTASVTVARRQRGRWVARPMSGVSSSFQIGVPGSFARTVRSPPGCHSPTRAQFYSDVFGLSADTHPVAWGTAPTYTTFACAGRQIAGVAPPMEEAPPQWNVYFNVVDADQFVAQAEALGAKLIVPAYDLEGKGRMATLTDLPVRCSA